MDPLKTRVLWKQLYKKEKSVKDLAKKASADWSRPQTETDVQPLKKVEFATTAKTTAQKQEESEQNDPWKSKKVNINQQNNIEFWL